MMKNIIKILFILIQFEGFAQMVESNSIEIETNNKFIEDFHIHSLKEDGILLVNSKSEFFNSDLNLHFTHFDSTFKVKWASFYTAKKNFDFDKYYINDNFYHVLFTEKESTNFGVFRLNLSNGESDYYEGNLLTRLDIQHFVVVNNKAFIGGEYNDRPVVVTFNFHDLNSKVLQDLHANNFTINAFETFKDSQDIWIYLKDQKNCSLSIKKYNYDGKLFETTKLGDKNINLISSKILKTSKNKPMMVGSYSDQCTEFSKGIYLLDMSNPTTDNIQLIPYSNLSNFYNFMAPKRKDRVIARNKIRESKGKSINQKYRILIHDIYNFDNQNILIGEIFYADYKPPVVNLPNMTAVRLGQNVFNSFRYTQAIICGFDEDGNIKWNNSISIDNVISTNLEPKVQINKLNELNLLAYPKEGRINSVVINEKDISIKKDKYQVSANNNLNTYYDNDSNLLAWFDNHFLVWGTKTQNLKEIFYIKKLTYQLDFNKN